MRIFPKSYFWQVTKGLTPCSHCTAATSKTLSPRFKDLSGCQAFISTCLPHDPACPSRAGANME
eukprot:3513979-Amphidinium_carterae.1